MDNLSDLANDLPPSNLLSRGRAGHFPRNREENSSACDRIGNPSRGAFSNQRGPGRGRSRVQGGKFNNASASEQRGSWGNEHLHLKTTATHNDKKNGNSKFTFKEPCTHTTNSYPKQSTEEQLKTIGNINNPGKEYLNKPKIKNTVDFNPDHTPAEMRVMTVPSGLKKYHREITSRDVIIVNDLFCKIEDKTIYQNLLKEAESNNNHEWKLWHGDNHMIADDKTRRNQYFPTFDEIINTIKEYFNMDIHATRFNWFRDTHDWKPYHHDAAAIKPEKAAVQNITVAVSFGTEREIVFQHAKSGSTVSFPLPNGTLYTFSNDVNVIWRHGVPQVPPERQLNEGRISIVAWGWVHGVINVNNPG